MDPPVALPRPDADRLVGRALADFGVALTSLTPVAGGWDVGASVWRGVTDVGVPLAVKLSRSSRVGGLLVSAHLASAHPGSVTAGIGAPLPTLSGQPFSLRDGARLSLAPWITGRSAMQTGMALPQWLAFGELLARVHGAQLPPTVMGELATEDYCTPDTVAVRAFDQRIRGGAVPAGHPLAAGLTDDWLAAADHLRTISEQTDRLGDELRDSAAPLVLCHADAHTGNVLVDDDGQVWLLDWDEAVLAPRERDLMFVVGGVLTDAPVTAEQQRWFFEGYGEARIDPVRLAYYRCSWAMQDVAGFASLILDGAGRPEAERAEALALFRSLLAPTGIVATAVRSLHELGRPE